MKAKSKILVIALSLCLLVASVIGITVSANDETKPEIAGMNFSYEDNTYIWYAVKATANVTAENTTMSLYNDAECTDPLQENIVGSIGDASMLGDGDYIVFKAHGLKAKDITKVIYAKATSNGVDSAIVEYSLAEYLLERLYVSERQGLTVLAEEKALYEELLEYGAAAQTLFNNIDKEDAEKETLATAYKIVKVFDGTLSLGGTQAIVESGANVVFTADDVNAKYEAVKIAADGTETKTAVNSGDTITVDAHTIIQQKQIAPPLTFDNESDLDGFTFSTNYVVDDRITAAAGVDTARQSQAFEIVDGKLVFNSPIAHNNVLNIPRTGDATGNLKAVFEADITVETTDVNEHATYGGAQWLNFIFYDPSTGTQWGAFYIMLEDGATSATVSENTNQAAKTSDYFKDGVEFSLKLEYVINPSGYNNVYVYLKDETGEFPEYGTANYTWRTTWNAAGSGWCNPDNIALKIDVARYQDIKVSFDNLRFDGE